mmetsp:Transcript_26619/g.48780  ORF Transcript_26619/g.48780 Transcript_26619/m.48780 type:complete len:149 (-) Transcript_26619:60-506(-)
MCREQVKIFNERMSELTGAGAKKVVCLVKEDIEKEVEDFKKAVWSGEVYLDNDLAVYKALGGGAVNKPLGLVGFLQTLFNPFSSARLKANIKRNQASGVKGNLKGEGFITGGCYVLGTDGSPTFSHLEEEIGDLVPFDDVVKGVKAAA